MKRSFSVVANSGHLHMYLWGELYGGIRALSLSLCKSEDFILTKASHDIAGINLSCIFDVRTGICIGLGVSIAFTASFTADIGVASGVATAVSITTTTSIASAFASTTTFAAALGLAGNLGKLLVA